MSAAMLWDVHLEGANFEEKRLAEIGQHRAAFIARRCPVSPVASPSAAAAAAAAGDNGAAVRAKGVYAHLSEEERIKKEHDMDAWRMEQFKRRDEERRLKEETERKKRVEERAAATLKQQREQISRAKTGKAKKVSGYVVFATEKRAQIQKANPSMPSAQLTKMCKVSWETCHKTIRKQYEDKAKVQNKAERDRINADKKKAKALQAKLDKEEKERQQAAAAAGEAEEEQIEWIMCEQCKKWRMVPTEMAQLLDSAQTAAWTCSQNTWDAPPPAGTSACDVPEQTPENMEEEDDEEDVAGASMSWPPEKFEVGMPCDAKDEFGNFYKAKIVAIGGSGGHDEHNVKVHYNGWGAKYDEWIDSRPDAGLLAQRGTHTKRAKPKNVYHGGGGGAKAVGSDASAGSTKRKAEEEREPGGSPTKKLAVAASEGQTGQKEEGEKEEAVAPA